MSTYVATLNGNYSPPAETIAAQGWLTADSRASSAFSTAKGLVSAIGAVSIPFTAVTSGFTAPAIGYTLSLPAVPAAPVIEFPEIPELTAPAFTSVTPVVPGALPEFTAVAPTIQILNKPDALVATAPGAAPTVTDVTLPDAPNIVLPDDPVLELLAIPDAPLLNLPVWAGSAPDGSGLATPTTGFIWGEDYYDSDLLNSVTSRLTTMLLGGTGLPPSIEQAIWDRGRAREDVTAKKATQEAYEEFASRGFMLPSGPLAGRVAEVWQKNREAASTYSRDVAVKQAELEIENLKFSVSTGIQLEGQLRPTPASTHSARSRLRKLRLR